MNLSQLQNVPTTRKKSPFFDFVFDCEAPRNLCRARLAISEVSNDATLPLLSESLSASCRVVLRWSSQTMVIITLQHDRIAWVRQILELRFLFRKPLLFPSSDQWCFWQLQHFHTLQRGLCSFLSDSFSARNCITTRCLYCTSLTAAAVVLSVRNLYNFVQKCRKLKICFT